MQTEKDFSDLWTSKQPVKLSRHQKWLKATIDFYRSLFLTKKENLVVTPRISAEQRQKISFVNNCFEYALEDELVQLKQDGYSFSYSQQAQWNKLLAMHFWQNKDELFIKLDKAGVSVEDEFFYQQLTTPSLYINQMMKNAEFSHSMYFTKRIEKMMNKEQIKNKIENDIHQALDKYALIHQNYKKMTSYVGREKSFLLMEQVHKNVYLPLYQFRSILIQNKSAKELFVLSDKFKLVNELLAKANISPTVLLEYRQNGDCRGKIEKFIEQELHTPHVKEQMKAFHENSPISIKTMIEEEKKLPLEYDNLPQIAQERLNKIEKIYEKLLKEELLTTEKEALTKLWEVNIKRAIVDYLRLSTEFKTSMRNVNGQSADELLLLTLDEFSQIFEQKFENINEAHFRQISVNARFATMKNKGI